MKGLWALWGIGWCARLAVLALCGFNVWTMGAERAAGSGLLWAALLVMNLRNAALDVAYGLRKRRQT